MAAVHFKRNGLNVQYVAKFFEKEQADDYFAQLKKLPFYRPTLKLRGKSIQPNCKILGFGDSHLAYDFSGTEVVTQPWTPLLLDIRRHVEKFTGCSFNFVLLNLYPGGSSFISHHKDNETTLHSVFPIVTVSFGEKRTIEFKRRKFNSAFMELQHGSLFSMEKPTNDLFTHGVTPEFSPKNMSISLTFRHLIPDVSSLFPLLNQESSKKKDVDSNQESFDPLLDDLNQNDWLVEYYQALDSIDDQFENWDLQRKTFV